MVKKRLLFLERAIPQERIRNSNLHAFDTGGHLLLGYEEEIKHQISNH
jgi:hypothetical protein